MTTRQHSRIAWLPLAAAALIAACSPSPQPARTGTGNPHASHAPDEAAPREYRFTGQVVALLPASKQVRIAHEAIPGYMDAMTMPFTVRDMKDVEGLAPGDLIEARLHVTSAGEWMDEVRKTGSRPLPRELTEAPAPPVDLIDPGDTVVAPAFTSTSGTPWTLDSLRGKAVALTFSYTRCPPADACASVERRFLDAQARALASPALKGRVHFVTVSFDAPHDTPAVLKAHGERVGADPSAWTFVTAPAADVEAFGARLGLTVMREPGVAGAITHNVRTAILTPVGTLSTLLRGSEWSAADLLQALEAARQ